MMDSNTETNRVSQKSRDFLSKTNQSCVSLSWSGKKICDLDKAARRDRYIRQVAIIKCTDRNEKMMVNWLGRALFESCKMELDFAFIKFILKVLVANNTMWLSLDGSLAKFGVFPFFTNLMQRTMKNSKQISAFFVWVIIQTIKRLRARLTICSPFLPKSSSAGESAISFTVH